MTKEMKIGQIFAVFLTLLLLIPSFQLLGAIPLENELTAIEEQHHPILEPLTRSSQFETKKSLKQPKQRMKAGETTKVGQYDDGGYARDVVVDGSYAYVADGFDGLEIIDISTPSNPTKVGQYNDGGNAWDVVVRRSYAYLADWEDDLVIIDISTPSNPTKVGQYDDEGPSGRAFSVVVSGSYAYVADGFDGLEIIDISTPSNPTKVGQYTDGGNARDVVVNGSYAYVAEDGLEIIDILTPSNPTKVGQYNDGGPASGVFVSGSYVYVADGEDGLEILTFTTHPPPNSTPGFEPIYLILGFLACVVICSIIVHQAWYRKQRFLAQNKERTYQKSSFK